MGYAIRIKICGITVPEDAAAAATSGADMIGLNFYPKSPRCIDKVRVGEVLGAIPESVEAVGVFADEVAETMLARVADWTRLRTIQVHGTWPKPVELHPRALFIAAHIADARDIAQLNRFLADCRASGQEPAAVLVDASVSGSFGGTGKTAPWQLLADFRPGLPLILAGGLTPENVAEAVRVVRPYAVDVASGVEDLPGRKDHARMRSFIENARNAAASLSGD
jgi:phosphoribosylanthranilate isomerase